MASRSRDVHSPVAPASSAASTTSVDPERSTAARVAAGCASCADRNVSIAAKRMSDARRCGLVAATTHLYAAKGETRASDAVAAAAARLVASSASSRRASSASAATATTLGGDAASPPSRSVNARTSATASARTGAGVSSRATTRATKSTTSRAEALAAAAEDAVGRSAASAAATAGLACVPPGSAAAARSAAPRRSATSPSANGAESLAANGNASNRARHAAAAGRSAASAHNRASVAASSASMAPGASAAAASAAASAARHPLGGSARSGARMSPRSAPTASEEDAAPIADATASSATRHASAAASSEDPRDAPARSARLANRAARARHVPGFSLAHVSTNAHVATRTDVSAECAAPDVSNASSVSRVASRDASSPSPSPRRASREAPERHAASVRIAPARVGASLSGVTRRRSVPSHSSGGTNRPIRRQHSKTSRETRSSRLAATNAEHSDCVCCVAFSSRNTMLVRSSAAALARSSSCQLDISATTGLTSPAKLFLTRTRLPSRGRRSNGGGNRNASSPSPYTSSPKCSGMYVIVDLSSFSCSLSYCSPRRSISAVASLRTSSDSSTSAERTYGSSRGS